MHAGAVGDSIFGEKQTSGESTRGLEYPHQCKLLSALLTDNLAPGKPYKLDNVYSDLDADFGVCEE